MSTQWGREETVIFPPHSPVYTFGAAFLALVLTLGFIAAKFAFGQTPLQKVYSLAYFRTGVGSFVNQHGKYRLLYVASGGRTSRLAAEEDVEPGSTATADGRKIPLTLSASALQQGVRTLYAGPVRSYPDGQLHTYFETRIFEGRPLSHIYKSSLLFGLLAFCIQLPFAVQRDVLRRKQMKYGRRLKGPVLLSAAGFNKAVQGDGIGFRVAEDKAMMRIPRKAEAQHIQIIGDTGSGKTTLLIQILRQIDERNETAIVYDPACEFVQRFYRPERGDIILNPLDDRCPYWGPSEELRRKAEAKAIAASLYQPTSNKKGEFFTETPQKIFSHLLTFGPTPQELVQWMSDPSEIDHRVKNTELAQIINEKAQQQRSGVLASLGLIADSLRMLPTKEQAKGRTWSATEWSEKRKGWIFITSKATEREALRPLHSLWIDLLVLRLLSVPKPDQTPVWFVLDELASLQRLPQLNTAITENRKSKNPLVLGFQGKAQLEEIYGHLAEVMLSQPATKVFLRTTEPKAAEWVSNAIGKVEIERMKETHFESSKGGKNFSLDRQVEPLVMDSEISGLADKHAFLKLGNNVARFSFLYVDLPKIAPDFIPREVEDDELTFDPLTLTPAASMPKPPLPADQLPEPAAAAAAPLEDAPPPPEEEADEPPLTDADAPSDSDAEAEDDSAAVENSYIQGGF